MAVEIHDPHTIHLGGDIVLVNDRTASTTITPGALVTRAGGVYINDDASSPQPAFALEQAEMNKDVDFDYGSGDLIKVGVGRPGSTFWALLASGQNVSDGDVLESAGDGTLTALVSGEALFRAIEAVNNTTGAAPRVRVEVL